MSGTNVRNQVAYGLSEALPIVFTPPIISNRDPLTKDKAPLGTIWVNKVGNEAYVLTSVLANSASWIALGGSGSFTNISASGTITAGGTITSTGGNIVSAGSLVCSAGLLVNAGGASISAGDLNVVTGDIEVATGSIEVVDGSIAGASLYSSDDLGGIASTTGITNAVNTTQGAGTLTIKSASANPGNNTGFLKFYVGTTAVFVPYFDTVAP